MQQTSFAGLKRAGVFITALDREGVRYRLHPLFRSTLQMHLQEKVSASRSPGLYDVWRPGMKNRGCWKRRSAMPVPAAVVGAAAMVGRHRQQLLDEMDFVVSKAGSDCFRPLLVDTNVDLTLVKAWLMYTRELKELRSAPAWN